MTSTSNPAQTCRRCGGPLNQSWEPETGEYYWRCDNLHGAELLSYRQQELAKLALFDRMQEALRAVENSGWSQAWLTELLAEADALAEEKE